MNLARKEVIIQVPRRTLGTQLILYLTGSILVVVLSMSFILFTSLRLQELVNDQFQSERFFQQLQREIQGIQSPLVEYLSSRSSTALGNLLIGEQNLRSRIPRNLSLSTDPVTLTQVEIFRMLESYLDLTQEAIQLKRARAITDYTQLFETMSLLNNHIVSQIDQISLQGLRTQLDNYESLLGSFRQLQFWNLLVIIFAFISAMLWMLASISKLTDPMHRLALMAGELSQGNFDIPDIPQVAVPEVTTVIEAFNTMKHDINQYIQEIENQKELEQEYMEAKIQNLNMEHLLKRMELYTMQAQMNPHFLFNTLNTGVQLAILEQAEHTADFMEKLAVFFRKNLREKNLIIPLSSEVEALESYFGILAVRFPSTLDLSLRVDRSILEGLQVPAMILQPIVENSVIHAFTDVTVKGSIQVTISLDHEDLIIKVSDNGIGIPKDLAEKLLTQHNRDQLYESKVMGLENVIQRLYFFYPNQTDRIVTITSHPGEGTQICITIDTKEEPCLPS